MFESLLKIIRNMRIWGEFSALHFEIHGGFFPKIIQASCVSNKLQWSWAWMSGMVSSCAWSNQSKPKDEWLEWWMNTCNVYARACLYFKDGCTIQSYEVAETDLGFLIWYLSDGFAMVPIRFRFRYCKNLILFLFLGVPWIWVSKYEEHRFPDTMIILNVQHSKLLSIAGSGSHAT